MNNIKKSFEEILKELKLLKKENETLKNDYQKEITELKTLLDSRMEKEIYYLQILESANEGIWSIDENKITTYVNPRLAEMMGYEIREMIGSSVFNYMDKDAANLAKEHIKSNINGIKENHQVELLRKDGTKIFTSIESSPIIDGNGKVSGALALISDITEHNRLENELKESLDLNQSLLQSIPFAMSIVDDKGIIQFKSENYIRQFGENPFGNNNCNIFCNDKSNCFDCPLKIGINIGETKTKESDILLNGKIFNIFHTGMFYKGKKAILEIFIDITERKKAEEEILKLSKGIEYSPASIIITDKRGCIEYVNPKFCELNGYTKDEVIGKNPRILKSGKMTKDYIKGLWEAILSGKEWRGELINKKKNGELYWESASISPIFNNEREITHFVAVKEDITLRKLFEDELNNLNDELKYEKDIIEEHLYQNNILLDQLAKSEAKLKEIIATKDKFFSIIAHDLKGPFSGFLGLTDLMAKETEALSVDEIKTMSEAINKSANSVYKLIEDLLLWSRTQIGSITYLPEKLDLYELSFNTTFSLRQTAENKGIELINSLPQRTEVTCDRNMISTVLRNLVSNAIKFTKDGGKVEIGICDISEIFTDTGIIIFVQDTGIGISQSNLAKLFKIETHYSTAGTKKESGTGLGLILSKEFIEKHGGRIWAESEEGKGSTFYFSLPI